MDSILARLEHAKKQIVDMEMKKLELSHEERRLNDQYEEDELRYKSMVKSKVFTLMISNSFSSSFWPSRLS